MPVNVISPEVISYLGRRNNLQVNIAICSRGLFQNQRKKKTLKNWDLSLLGMELLATIFKGIHMELKHLSLKHYTANKTFLCI